MRRYPLPVLTLVLVSLLAVAGSSRAAELPEGFRLEPIVAGLTEPSAMAGTPDYRILITERTTGNVRQVRWGQLQAAPLCNVAVNATGEGGLLGIAVHPGFRSNGWIYLYYTDLASGNNKVTRFEIAGNSCLSGFDILADLGAGPGLLNNGGGLDFGPDGKLYVTTGDTDDSGAGQDPDVLEAKVLRVNDDGSIPLDNPDPSSAVYALGVRNGGGVSVTSAGDVYVADAGSTVDSAHDELNWVAPGGNLGWDVETGTGGIYDPPLSAWLPTIGARAVVAYEGEVFPDLAADGKDNDEDKWGPDHFPGIKRTDDNGGLGVCVRSVENGLPCGPGFADCSPARTGEAAGYCEIRDDAAEWCPGGTAAGDDDCDDLGSAGLDEPDESYKLNVFTASTQGIRRAVLDPSDPAALSSASTFFDATFLASCPTTWTGVMAGDDGLLYAVARNSGGATGGLYRIVHDETPGPREVSASGSPFQLRVDKDPNPNRALIYWEDLREDSMQPRNNGDNPILPVREYTIWMGTIGNWYSHVPVPGNGATTGDLINDAYRRKVIQVDGTQNLYFLVSGRGANLEGSLGRASNGTPRPGYATTDVCNTIGYHQFPTWNDFACAQNVTLIDEHDRPVTLHSLREHVVFLDFSAIWCLPCYLEADNMQDVHLDFKDRGVKVITVLMDEESQTQDWSQRPLPAECRVWEDRQPLCLPDGSPPDGICSVGNAPCASSAACPAPADHTFSCWADPLTCTGSPCTGGFSQEGWPKFNSHNALPTNVVLDHGLRVAYTASGYDEGQIRGRMNALLGLTDQCLH